ncbi:MAG: 16S rRNA (cytosine(1402)-N(4))-methyltransferase RsmH [Muribaculaceae bacterium]|nr:16S rRNA (cytosine(1402)-N(4))-methyltransferase RsmH [Muribaculaceae bacterium]
MESETYHIPALLTQSVDGLDIRPDGIYVDVTFGGGGHSRAILSRLGERGHLYGFDRDTDAYANAPDDPRFTFVHSDFRYISNFLHYHGVEQVDGILADLGVSFHHFDSAERGFSFRSDAPLDMRMNRSGGRTCAELLAGYDKEEIERLLRSYTDLKRPGAIASAIVRAREKNPVETTGQLVEAVKGTLNPKAEKKDLAQVFQALRIEVNGEMDALRGLLEQSLRVLRPGGRLAVITYHSIEDRMVKNFIRSGNVEGEIDKDIFGNISTPWKAVTRSPIVPDKAETEANPRSRSAKLRIAEKK